MYVVAADSDTSKAGCTVETFSQAVFDFADVEELTHIQADGFWGLEKGFEDAEQLWRQKQQQD